MTTTLSGLPITGPVDTPPPQVTSRRRKSGWLNYLVLIFFSLIYLYPFLIRIGTSFKFDPDATANPLNPIPQEWTLHAYRQLGAADFPLWLMNSVIVTSCVTVGRVFVDSLAGYALARLHFQGRAALSALFIGIIAVPRVVLLIPKYLVLVQLGIYNTCCRWPGRPSSR